MKNVVYLTGAGAIQAEIDYAGQTSRLAMTEIGRKVYQISKKNGGEYYELVKSQKIPTQQDVELMMSLFESYMEIGKNSYDSVCRELRTLFREYLVSRISRKLKKPNLHISLLHICKEYPKYIGSEGEKMLGILTINYDGIIEEAFSEIYRCVNFGLKFESEDFDMNNSIPPLLKLHGSFNWKITNSNLKIARELERAIDDKGTNWVPPSVYKKPSGTQILSQVWKRARKLLLRCDILRVIGSSLRNEDWPLISLIFTSQLERKFDIELIIPEKSASGSDEERKMGVIERLRFLANMKPPRILPVFRETGLEPNIFYNWLLGTTNDIARKGGLITKDELIRKTINGDKIL